MAGENLRLRLYGCRKKNTRKNIDSAKLIQLASVQAIRKWRESRKSRKRREKNWNLEFRKNGKRALCISPKTGCENRSIGVSIELGDFDWSDIRVREIPIPKRRYFYAKTKQVTWVRSFCGDSLLGIASPLLGGRGVVVTSDAMQRRWGLPPAAVSRTRRILFRARKDTRVPGQRQTADVDN